MKKNILKIIVALLIVFGSIASLGFKFWADDQALSVDRPSFIKPLPNDQLAILIGNTLFFLDRDGYTRTMLDFGEKGFRISGDFDFFQNGDILFYNETREPSQLERIAQYLRIKEYRQNSPAGADGLYRCDNRLQHCKLFSEELPAFHTTFRVFIDTRKDTVYIADTPRFVLYKLDHKGHILARKTRGLLFPNQLLIDQNRLYIANTNHNSISVLRIDNAHFGEMLEQHDIRLPGGYIWPGEIIKVKDQWWIGVYGNNMKLGRLQIFDDDWNPVIMPTVDDKTDITTLARFGNQVIAGDWSNMAFYRFSLKGQPLSDFHNPEIDNILEQSKTQAAIYQAYSRGGMIAFILILIAGFAAAFILEKKESIAVLTGKTPYPKPVDKHATPLSPPGNGVYWIENKLYSKRHLYSTIFALGIGMIVISNALLLSTLKAVSYALIAQYFMMAVIIAIGFWLWRRQLRYRIGVFKGQLLIDNGQGKVVIGKGDDIQYNKTMLMIRHEAAILGQPGRRLFPDEEIEKWVVPLMLQGRETSIWSMYKTMWRSRHPMVILLIAILAFSLVSVVTFLD